MRVTKMYKYLKFFMKDAKKLKNLNTLTKYKVIGYVEDLPIILAPELLHITYKKHISAYGYICGVPFIMVDETFLRLSEPTKRTVVTREYIHYQNGDFDNPEDHMLYIKEKKIFRNYSEVHVIDRISDEMMVNMFGKTLIKNSLEEQRSILHEEFGLSMVSLKNRIDYIDNMEVIYDHSILNEPEIHFYI